MSFSVGKYFSVAFLAVRTVAACSILILFSGCSTWYMAVDDSKEPLILNRPNIAPNQIATVYANDYVIQALRDTKLFASVKGADNIKPTANGIFISVIKTWENESRNSGFIGSLYTGVTMGAIPDKNCRSITRSYQITVYQDGAQISRTNASSRWVMECGSTALIDDSNRVYRDDAAIVVNRMVTGLNKK